MFWLESGTLTPPSTNVMYLCKAVMKNAKMIAGTSVLFRPHYEE